MHIAFFKEEAKIKTAEESAAALKEALEHESSLYALASIIDTVQFLFSKKYKAAHIRGEDEKDKEKLLEAQQKALRFFSKLSNGRGRIPNDR